ncbi:response regulator transcription factor [Hoeflea sp. YIM 152468]|uniref:response regulator transcription factor n=1 Tax=Hoeflea sp. YIM 152468 TaxID=3031759 RepID=UPI0023DB27A2|nr:response regulator transcription factor [Hoeflea sp. YIM 152468]MDF1609801.1 response regulator transcription factor [Hoeflea sp. YIM 152468]
MHFLVVEDTDDVSEAITERLSRGGHICDRAVSLEDAKHFASASAYDLVVLDINLPDGSGLDFLKWLRQRKDAVPVLVLTARLAVDDKIGALDFGADDYMVKPFDLGELEARVRAIVRRRSGEAGARLSAGNLEFDMATRLATVNGEPLQLTPREQVLLEIFLIHKGRVLEKDELVTRLFGMEADAGPNAIELYVGRLRRKLCGADLEIRTLRGLGYQALSPTSKMVAR